MRNAVTGIKNAIPTGMQKVYEFASLHKFTGPCSNVPQQL